MAQYIRYPSDGGSRSIPTYATAADLPASATDGSLAITLDDHVLYEYNAGTAAWEAIASPGSVLSLGSFGSSPNASGATISSNVLTLQPADGTHPGGISTGTQTFGGNKTFTGTIGASNLSGTNTGDVTISTANGLSLVGQALSLALSSTSTTGALSSTDWNTFNGKQSALTIGDLTDVGTDGITVTGGTGAIIGSGTSISQHVADATHNGYLSSADWSTFNGKQAAGNYITALTGDATASGPGSAALTLATVNSNVGSFGGATTSGTFTVNAKGLITAASSTSIQIAESQVTNLVSDLAAKQSTTLTSAHILVGNGSNVATDVAMSGDIAISNTGATSYSGTVPLNKGGTGQTTKSAAFDALSPMSASGDIIYGDTSGTGTRLAKGSDGQVLTLASGVPTWAAASGGSTTAPTVQKFTSSSGTYTRPTGPTPLYIRIRMAGGGGGGGGSGPSAGAPSDGSDTTFGSSFLTASGGGAGTSNGGNGGTGGATSIAAGPLGIGITGAGGGGGNGLAGSSYTNNFAINLNGGTGGSTPFGGGGLATEFGAGGAAATNSGSGGGGSGTQCLNNNYGTGSGGGAGGYIDVIITSPSSSYSYSIGAGGSGGTAGTNGFAGGNGAAGIIIVEEFYQ
jgi:hypothetical protein